MLMQRLERIKNSYIRYFNVTNLNFQIVIADDMYECQKKYGFQDSDFQSIDEATARKNWKHVAACMKYPKKMTEPFTLIFKRPYLERITEAETYRLVFHELTHMCDYCEYARIHRLTSYEQLFRDPNAVLFQHWSEYHAERRGYAALLRHTYGVRLKYDEFKSGILHQETISNMQLYSEQYTNTAKYGSTRQVYFTMHLISHLSILSQIMPRQMTDILDQPPFTYRGIEWIKKLMYIFHKYPTLEAIDPHFTKITRVIAEGLAVPEAERWLISDNAYRIPSQNLKFMDLTHNLKA